MHAPACYRDEVSMHCVARTGEGIIRNLDTLIKEHPAAIN